MIDWNNDGRVDSTEVVLTNHILQEIEDNVAFRDEHRSIYEKKESWIVRFFRRRKDVR